MKDIHDSVESSLSEVDTLRSTLKKSKLKQVRSIDERSVIKAVSFSWFTNHRRNLVGVLTEQQLLPTDQIYKELLALSDRHASRKKYDLLLKNLRNEIGALRTQNIVALSSATPAQGTSNAAPNFSILISDTTMQAILARRWDECASCVAAKSPLAATVMMGGLLEALLLARINQLSPTDKPKVFRSAAAPKDRKTGTPLPLQEWGLKDYIAVAHELGWISQTEKDLGNVLRDYRNFIHPYKEHSHNIRLEPQDAVILWELSKSISRQILK